MRERTVLSVLKSFLSNVYQRREGCRNAKDGEILILGSLRTHAFVGRRRLDYVITDDGVVFSRRFRMIVTQAK